MTSFPPVVCFGEALGLVAAQLTAPGSSSSPATLTFAGAESNVAIGLARQGVASALCSAVGTDWFGQAILRSLHAERVDSSLVKVDKSARTGLMIKQPQVLSEPSVVYYRADSAFAQNAAQMADALPPSEGGVLFVSGITPALRADVREAFARLLHRAATTGTRIYFDINYRSKLWTWEEARAALKPLIGLCQVVFSSENEAQSLTQAEGGFAGAAKALLALGAKEVVIKRGPEGASYFSAETQLDAPAHKIPLVVDPIGAGDAFDSGFLAGRVKGYSLEKSLALGAVMGAAACSFVGDWEGLPLEQQTARLLEGDLESAR
jgi:2-dehydro-3-deoxygluconokinase